MMQLMQAMFSGGSGVRLRSSSTRSARSDSSASFISHTSAASSSSSSSQKEISGADVLAVELVERVFEHLSVADLGRASCVCRVFAAARWLRVDLAPYASKMTAQSLSAVLRKQPHVLIMPRCGPVDVLVTVFAERRRGLPFHALDLRGCHLGEEGLAVLIEVFLPVRDTQAGEGKRQEQHGTYAQN
jgi:hypothetical protein